MASCVRNIRTRNYQNPMSGMLFLRHSVVMLAGKSQKGMIDEY